MSEVVIAAVVIPPAFGFSEEATLCCSARSCEACVVTVTGALHNCTHFVMWVRYAQNANDFHAVADCLRD
jgi:hypothetical protein